MSKTLYILLFSTILSAELYFRVKGQTDEKKVHRGALLPEMTGPALKTTGVWIRYEKK